MQPQKHMRQSKLDRNYKETKALFKSLSIVLFLFFLILLSCCIEEFGLFLVCAQGLSPWQPRHAHTVTVYVLTLIAWCLTEMPA